MDIILVISDQLAERPENGYEIVDIAKESKAEHILIESVSKRQKGIEKCKNVLLGG